MSASLPHPRRAAHPAPPPPVVLWALAVAACAAASAVVVLALTSDHVTEPGIQAALMDWGVLAYVLAGTVAWWRRPASRFGPLMIAAGFAFFATSLSWSNAGVPFTIGVAVDLLPAVLFLHVFLAFPTGRLERPFERVLVAAAYVVALGLQLVGLALDGFGPDNLVALTSQPEAAYTLLRAQLVALSASFLAGIALLAVRRRDAGRPVRRSVGLLVDAFAFALVMLAVLYLSGAYGFLQGQIAFETIRRATFFVLGLAPIVFLAGLLQARLARSAVGDLLVELRASPAPADLRNALAHALGDPSLTLVYWLAEYRTWADLDGRRVTLTDVAGERSTTMIDRGDEHVAALLHEAALDDEPELLEAVVAAAAIAIENAQLHAELQARLDELHGSRARIVEAGDSERRRLERNLHDGAQQRLVSLSLGLRLVANRLPPGSDAEELLSAARGELAASLSELRELAQGIHPAVLSDHGLAVALESVAARAPVPVELKVDLGGRLAPPLEVAAYYLVCEALTNVGKYANASSAAVEVIRDDGHVVVEVRDDGDGGADPDGGSGLRGLADRVEALDGHLRIWSPPGGGTSVRAELPCA
jgi:signal transduction histidine kinase